MSEQHTQGLLTLSRLGNVTGGPVRTYAGGPGQDQIFMVCSLDSDNGDKEANARRVVACWNACNGLHTESLERGKPLADQIVDALNQRDELLAALNYASRNVHASECDVGYIDGVIDKINAIK